MTYIPAPIPNHPHAHTRVHMCVWASQPDIEILCTGEMTTPAWEPLPPEAEELKKKKIYLADNGEYYTFEFEKVNCFDCIKKYMIQKYTQ